MMSRWAQNDVRHGCIGVDMGSGGLKALCSRGTMCPRCEERRATSRAWNLCNRLQNDIDIAEDSELELKVGILSLTLPGKQHWIRRGTLREQYSYLTERATLPNKVGHHSMRGLNTLMKNWGVSGGCHNIEFTWNSNQEWWNVHTHTIMVGFAEDMNVPLKDCRTYSEKPFEPGENLLDTSLEGKSSTDLYRLGFGGRYTLDWAEPHEFHQAIRYASKVAYMTKPIKAPGEKRSELRNFFNGKNGTLPRLSRPIGDWGRSFVPNDII